MLSDIAVIQTSLVISLSPVSVTLSLTTKRQPCVKKSQQKLRGIIVLRYISDGDPKTKLERNTCDHHSLPNSSILLRNLQKCIKSVKE